MCVHVCVRVCVCDWTEALPWALWEGIASWPAAEEAERKGERTRQARGALFDAPSLLGRERPLKKGQRLRGRERTRETAIEREEKKREGEKWEALFPFLPLALSLFFFPSIPFSRSPFSISRLRFFFVFPAAQLGLCARPPPWSGRL